MIDLEVREVTKSFGTTQAVAGVSLEATGGEVFALLGPNGAGKTTLIRMIMDIVRPDRGHILFDGAAVCDAIKRRIGYLPEERGLYRKQRLGEVVAFFGRLHGLSRDEAEQATGKWLERMNLVEWRNHLVEELSKGMQQKAQLALTLLHEPPLVILDEPFAGLDPVNTRLVKDIILTWRRRGHTVLLSTHQMAQVEQLADRVFMISRGHRVLYGTLAQIKRDHSDNAVLLNPEVSVTGLEEVVRTESRAQAHFTKVWLREEVPPALFLRHLLDRNEPVGHYEVADTPLEDIFVRLAQQPVQPVEAP